MFTITKQPSKADRLAEEMLRLYMLYWMPQVILNVASGQIELGGRWLDPVAEDLYKWLESRLVVAKKELNHEQ